MGLFGPSKSTRIIEQLTAQVNQMASLMNTRISGMTIYPTYSVTDNAERYCTTDDVYSIVRMIATAAASIPIYNYIKNGSKLDDAPEGNELSLLLETPFEGMSSYESFYKIYATRLVQGECILYKERPELGPNRGKLTRLIYMEPQSVNIIVSDTWPRKIIAYQYAPEGRVVLDNIKPEDIIHMKYFNPKVSFTGNELRGLSPLAVLKRRLTRVDSNNDVATAQLQNGGVPGIVYDKTPASATAGDLINKRKDNFYKYLTNSANKGAPFFTGNELGYIELGLKLVDMQVTELANIDFKSLCNAYGVSARLFNNDSTGSEHSDTNARVSLYTNAVIPEVKSVVDCLNMGLVPEFKGKNYKLNYDTSEVSELQDNLKDMVLWLEKAWWLTPNEKREMMDYDLSTEPLFDQYLLPQSLQTVEDFENIDLDLTDDYKKPVK